MSNESKAKTSSDETIYATYRANLRNLNKAYGDRNSRAADRRNTARLRTADRHKVSCAIIKQIVSKLDSERGIEHNHPQKEIEYMDYLATRKAVIETLRSNQGLSEESSLQCEKCGAASEYGDDAFIRLISVTCDGYVFESLCFQDWAEHFAFTPISNNLISNRKG